MATCSPGAGGVSQTALEMTVSKRRKRIASRFLGRALRFRAHRIPVTELKRSALVFSPHPDDECLGCGGTILKKKQAGATVKLVHMTDGSGSHAHLISKQELRRIRGEESLKAAAALGVDDTYFLDFEDSALMASIDAGIMRVSEILEREQPEEVYVPYLREPMRQAADHVAATEIVLSALRTHGRKVVVWEYPVWFWLHWPWVSLRQVGCPPIKSRHVAKNTLRSLFGWRAFQELRYAVEITDVLERKAAALREHRSQMSSLIPSGGWMTLEHVSKGEFLDCFHWNYEFFRRSEPEAIHATPSSHL